VNSQHPRFRMGIIGAGIFAEANHYPSLSHHALRDTVERVAVCDLDRGRADDAAILAPGRQVLTYAGLRTQGAGLAAILRAHDAGPRDRVAMVLPNGPELATAFLSVASVATAAPLNPALSGRELDIESIEITPEDNHVS